MATKVVDGEAGIAARPTPSGKMTQYRDSEERVATKVVGGEAGAAVRPPACGRMTQERGSEEQATPGAAARSVQG